MWTQYIAVLRFDKLRMENAHPNSQATESGGSGPLRAGAAEEGAFQKANGDGAPERRRGGLESVERRYHQTTSDDLCASGPGEESPSLTKL